MNFYKNPFRTRLILDILITLTIIESWWFFTIPLLLLSVWVFPFYIEILLAGFAFDSLYGMQTAQSWHGYAGTIVCTSLWIIVLLLKKLVRK